eukprot:CAMPEP_0181339966 /NCGR_PEP_ID=MMETSP1101-20121128/29574_1 /TAXON_ID=46948 /ORGANISM="Rhodomonas abbreviata, Strain Caron Lab Isolate" /LENGTH=75 /DNA_ID=CAMNT_0023451043 /DNA_START=58 /DNA_END=285 /DNA_ORIENTATION=-
MREAVFTVSPNTLNLGLAVPTTPAHTGPEERPTRMEDGWPSGRTQLIASCSSNSEASAHAWAWSSHGEGQPLTAR